jgi:antitoxin component of MazEF toxin-antitoxin module
MPLATLPVDVMVATAGRANLARVPERVFVADFLPGNEAARRSAFVISNGGSATTHQALSEGVPVLGCIEPRPILGMNDVEHAGAGILLRAGTLRVDTVRDAAARALREDTLHDAARRMASELARYAIAFWGTTDSPIGTSLPAMATLSYDTVSNTASWGAIEPIVDTPVNFFDAVGTPDGELTVTFRTTKQFALRRVGGVWGEQVDLLPSLPPDDPGSLPRLPVDSILRKAVSSAGDVALVMTSKPGQPSCFPCSDISLATIGKGEANWSIITVDRGGDSQRPSVAFDPAGHVVVAWSRGKLSRTIARSPSPSATEDRLGFAREGLRSRAFWVITVITQMKLRIRRVGNSLGVLIPKAALDDWGLGEGDIVDLERRTRNRAARRGSHHALDELKRRIAVTVVSACTANQIRARGLANLYRWKQRGVWVSAYDEWQAILESASDGELFAAMLGQDERSNRLRQSPPYVGLLPRAEIERLNEEAPA